jgi:hypothetical protein
MKEKTNNKKGFIQIPLLALIASIVVVSVGSGAALYKQGKLAPLIANISQTFKKTEDVKSENKNEKSQLKEEQFLLEEKKQGEKSQSEKELEQSKLESEKAKQEAEKAKDNAERAMALVEANIRAEQEKQQQQQEEVRRLAEEQRQKEIELEKARAQKIENDLLIAIKRYQEEQKRKEDERIAKQQICDQEKNRVNQEYKQKADLINSQIEELRAKSNCSGSACLVGAAYRKIREMQNQISILIDELRLLDTENVVALNEVIMTKCSEATIPVPRTNIQPLSNPYYNDLSIPDHYLIYPDGLGGYDVYNQNDPTDTSHIQCDNLGLCTVY